MAEKILSVITTILIIILAPCFITLLLNGINVSYVKQLEEINSGKDVLIEHEDGNFLVDIKEYVAGVLPDEIGPEQPEKTIQSKAREIEDNVLGCMSERNIINATELDYNYYSRQDMIEKWGEKYASEYMEIYAMAVIKISE